MKNKTFTWAARTIAVLAVVTVSAGALAEHPRLKVLSGVINAYTPQATTGPYEIRGPWTLKWKCEAGKADFYAAVDMELSDGWVISKNMSDFDPQARSAHTHHISVVGAEVTPIPNGFRLMGKATFTLNGGAAPMAIDPSPVVIDVTGGSELEFSNLTLTFEAPGSTHFGSEPLPGVVQSVREER